MPLIHFVKCTFKKGTLLEELLLKQGTIVYQTINNVSLYNRYFMAVLFYCCLYTLLIALTEINSYNAFCLQ